MLALRRIVCPVDLSDLSERGLRHAAWLCAWSKAELDVLYVLPRGVDASGRPVEPTFDVRARLRHWVDDATSGETLGRGVYARVHVATGDVIATILDYAVERESDVIVMATHGRTGFDRLAYGSVAEAVLRRARCPVLTVSPSLLPPRVPSLAYRRILVPLELASPARHALACASGLAERSGATVVVVHLVETAAAADTADRAPIEAGLWAALPPRTRREMLPTVAVRAKPEDEILSAAVQAEADLIVMGVHGRNALATIVFGSTANSVVRRACCPVLTVRAPPHRRRRPLSKGGGE
jgi:nucleotide-binding universal stress UspA family protein